MYTMSYTGIYVLRAIYDNNEYSVNTSYQISAYQAVLKIRCLLTRETMVIIITCSIFWGA